MQPEKPNSLTPVPTTSRIWKDLVLPDGVYVFNDINKRRYVVLNGAVDLLSRPWSVVNRWRTPGPTLSAAARYELRKK